MLAAKGINCYLPCYSFPLVGDDFTNSAPCWRQGGGGKKRDRKCPFSTGISEHISLLLSEFSGTGMSPSVFHALAFIASLEGEGQGDGPALPHPINWPHECP